MKINNIMYKTREGGATVTVKVPFNCANHCPFCINKREYSPDYQKMFSMKKILKNIHLMDSLTPNCDFVFTGGEPLADLDKLGTLLDAVPETHKIFINTSIMCQSYNEEKLISFLRKYSKKITGLNISRHFEPYVEECSDGVIQKIKDDLGISVRINCVIYKPELVTSQMISAYLSRWKKIGIKHIQFRKNYMQTTLDNLYVEDSIQVLLGKMFTPDHSNDKVCRMRTGYYYKDQDGMKISYHKTLPFSIIKEPEGLYIYNVLYDIIINQDGSLDADWDGTPLDVEAYKTVIYEKEK